jgi:O-antigen/teichoic acid export membrane protein
VSIAVTNHETEIAAKPAENLRQPLELLRTGFHTIGSNALCAMGALLTTWVVARLAGPTYKGAYDLYLATAAMVNIVVGFSLPSGLVYVSARKASNLVKLVPVLVMVAALEGAITFGTFFVLHRSRLGTIFLPVGAGNILILGLSLAVALGALGMFLRALLVGSHCFIQANIGDLSKQGIGVITAAVALTIGIRGHHGVMALICANLVTLALGATIYLRAIPFRQPKHSENSGFKEALAYSSPCYFANLAQYLNYRLDVFFVNAIVGAAGLGIYQLAVTLTQSLLLVPTAAATMLLPLVAAEHERPVQNAQRTAQVARLIVFISTVSALILGGVSYWIIPRAFGQAFSASVFPLLVLLPGAVALALASVLASHLAGMGFPQLNLQASVAGLFVTVPLDIILIPRAGIIGAAFASSCAYLLSTSLNIWYFRRKTQISVRDIVLISPGEIRSMLVSCKKLIETKKTLQKVSVC